MRGRSGVASESPITSHHTPHHPSTYTKATSSGAMPLASSLGPGRVRTHMLNTRKNAHSAWRGKAGRAQKIPTSTHNRACSHRTHSPSCVDKRAASPFVEVVGQHGSEDGDGGASKVLQASDPLRRSVEHLLQGRESVGSASTSDRHNKRHTSQE